MQAALVSRPRVFFEVEKIIGISSDGNYQVQWAPAWVSRFHLVGCEHLVQEFLAKQSEEVNTERTRPHSNVTIEIEHSETHEITLNDPDYDQMPLQQVMCQEPEEETHWDADTSKAPPMVVDENVIIDEKPIQFCNESSFLDVHKQRQDQQQPQPPPPPPPQPPPQREQQHTCQDAVSFMVDDRVKGAEKNVMPYVSSVLELQQENRSMISKHGVTKEHEHLHTGLDDPMVKTTSWTPKIDKHPPNFLNSVENSCHKGQSSTVIQQSNHTLVDQNMISAFIKNEETDEWTQIGAISSLPSLIGVNKDKGDTQGDNPSSSLNTSRVHWRQDDSSQNLDATEPGSLFNEKQYMPKHPIVLLGKHRIGNISGNSATRKHQQLNQNGQYKCHYCNKTFTQRRLLTKHLRWHRNYRRYTCSFCPSTFRNASNLKHHLRIHTGEKPFTCEECGKSFAQKGNLKTHKKTHTGDKPYCCNNCGKTFIQLSHLKSHTHRCKNITKAPQ